MNSADRIVAEVRRYSNNMHRIEAAAGKLLETVTPDGEPWNDRKREMNNRRMGRLDPAALDSVGIPEVADAWRTMIEGPNPTELREPTQNERRRFARAFSLDLLSAALSRGDGEMQAAGLAAWYRLQYDLRRQEFRRVRTALSFWHDGDVDAGLILALVGDIGSRGACDIELRPNGLMSHFFGLYEVVGWLFRWQAKRLDAYVKVSKDERGANEITGDELSAQFAVCESPDPARAVEEADFLRYVITSAALTAQERKAIELVCSVEGIAEDYGALAQRLGCQERTARNHVANARAKIWDARSAVRD